MSNADLTQYNGSQAFPATADVGTNADPYLTPTDGFTITALSNLVNEAPVNVSLRRLKDYVLGLRGAIIGDFVGASRKTFKAVDIDGAGGLASGSPAGSLKVSGASGSETTVPTTAYAVGTCFSDSVTFGFARGYWDGANMVLTRGFNVKTLTRIGVGSYRIIFHPVLNSPATAMVITCATGNGVAASPITIADDGAGRLQVDFQTWQSGVGVVDAPQFFVEAKAY